MKHQKQSAKRRKDSRTRATIPELVAGFDSLPDSKIVLLPVVMAMLSRSRSAVWRLHRSGTLIPVKLGKRSVGYRVGTVRAYLASLKSKAA